VKQQEPVGGRSTVAYVKKEEEHRRAEVVRVSVCMADDKRAVEEDCMKKESSTKTRNEVEDTCVETRVESVCACVRARCREVQIRKSTGFAAGAVEHEEEVHEVDSWGLSSTMNIQRKTKS